MLPVYAMDPLEAASLFRSHGFRMICANIRDSVDVVDADLSFPLVLVTGGEKRGISRALLDESDLNVRIGYGRSFNGSLGSAPATAILAYSISNYNRHSKEAPTDGSKE